MRKKITSIIAFAAMLTSTWVHAVGEGSFQAKLLDVPNTVATTNARIVAVTQFADFDLAVERNFRIRYIVENLTFCDFAAIDTLFDSTATITNGELRVATGNRANGKITLTYVPEDLSIKARFRMNIDQLINNNAGDLTVRAIITLANGSTFDAYAQISTGFNRTTTPIVCAPPGS